jgi:hypothetical protein
MEKKSTQKRQALRHSLVTILDFLKIPWAFRKKIHKKERKTDCHLEISRGNLLFQRSIE